MGPIFHIATAADWSAAQQAGAYTTSTRGRTLAEEGFIHASRGDQWPAVRDRFYADVTEPLVLLRIDPARLDVPVVDEPGEAGSAETFPHIYGPLRTDAVVTVLPLSAYDAAAPRSNPPSTPSSNPAADFSTLFLREMFAHVLIAGVVLAGIIVGLGVGAALGEETAMLVGALAGALIGLAVARWLHLRRRAASISRAARPPRRRNPS